MTDKKITWIGIDVSKKEIEIHSYENTNQLPNSLPNTKLGMKKLISTTQKIEHIHFIFEATGGYEKLLLTSLQKEGLKASRINPSLARNFAKAQGILSKTDSIDAKVLTDYGIKISPRETLPVDPVIEEIQALLKYRNQLINELHRERMQLEHQLPKSVETIVNKRIKQLQKHTEQVTTMMLELKEKSAEINEQVELLTQTNGVGEKSALSLLAAMA